MNALNWFDVPAVDFERARKFYSTILGQELPLMEGMENYAAFPAENGGVGGGLGPMDDLKPGGDGALIYLNGGDDLSTILDRVEAAGGKVTMPKTSIGPHGWIARFVDTEGNLIGLHSQQ